MDQNTFGSSLDYEIEGVRFVSKAKPCGKENCSACPHAGYWYAYVPGALSKLGARVEVYLGRAWVSDDLLAKLLPVMSKSAGAAFRHTVDLQLLSEDVERLVIRERSLVQDAAALERDYKRRLATYQSELKVTRRQLVAFRAKLKRGKEVSPAVGTSYLQ